MADPLSIISGVIGALSLAIETCQGAAKYYGSFKEAREEIARMRVEVDSFDTTIQVLQRAVKGRHVSPDIRVEGERLLTRARHSINELQTKLRAFWREASGSFVQLQNETKEMDKTSSKRRNRLIEATRHIKELSARSRVRIRDHSNKTVDRAKFAFREPILRKLWDILDRIKSDLAIIMPLLSNDATNKTLDGMDAMNAKADQMRKDIQLLNEQANDAIVNFGDKLNSLQSDLKSANDHNNDNAIQRQDDFMNKAETFLRSMEHSYDKIEETAEDLRAKANEFDTNANRIGGAADGVTDQHAFEFKQMSQEISSIEDSVLSKIHQVASDIEVGCTGMTRTVNETSGRVKAIQENMGSIGDDVSYIKNRDQAIDDSAFLDWFSPLTTGFEQKQSDSFNTRCKQGEAARIFLGSEDYLLWREGSGYGLWCLGGPGVGKTILASSIIHDLKKIDRQDQVLVYLYCNYAENKNHTPSAYTVKLLAHVVRQLAKTSPSSTQAFAELRQRYLSSKVLPDRAECHEAMLTVASSYSEILLVMDGLDECPEVNRDELFEEFESLKPKVRFLITSRCKFGGLFDPQHEICVNIRASDVDIENYVRASTKNFQKFMTDITNDKPFQEKILKRIVERANGMFLLAYLHVEDLKYMTSYYDIEETLALLPDSLGPTYDKVIERMKERNPRLASVAKKLITWVAFAETPLTVEELVQAVAIEPGDICLTRTKILQQATLLNICPELFEFIKPENTLRFIHYSVQEHFTTRFSSGQSLLALSCLSYLSFDDFEEVAANCHDSSFVGEFLAFSTPDFTLLEYASCNWGHHAKRTNDATVRKGTFEFLERKMNILFSIEVIATTNSRGVREYFNYCSPYQKHLPVETHSSLKLWIATYFGWYALVAEILHGPKQVVHINYAFQIAIGNYDKDLIRLFVRKGAKLSETDINCQTALHRAAKVDDGDFALELLNSGADISLIMGADSQSALHLAAKHGNTRTVKLFLEHFGDRLIHAKGDRWGDTILHLAVMSARVDLVAMLLREGAEVNAVNKGGEAPLQVAISRLNRVNAFASYEILELLVTSGAKVNASDHAGRTVLHYAAFKGDVVVIDRLLSCGANVDNTDQLGRTALWFAARSGHSGAISSLIQRGAQVNTRDYEKSALWEAVYAKRSTVVDILLRNGADVHQIGVQGDPILTRLTRYCILDSNIAEQLLEAWADPNVVDSEGLTTLDYASRLGSKALMEVLVEYGAIETGKKPYGPHQLQYKAQGSLDALGGPKFGTTAKEPIDVSISSLLASRSSIKRVSIVSKQPSNAV